MNNHIQKCPSSLNPTKPNTAWQSQLDLSQPYWQDYLPFLARLEKPEFPNCKDLNALLPDHLVSAGGRAISFAPSTELDNQAYEHRIYTSGQISTRANNFHDLFNALVWARFPGIKTAMNARHYQSSSEAGNGRRGIVRDALTLFDECGVIIYSANPDVLTALTNRHWSLAYQKLKSSWGTETHIGVCGHAMLEKYLNPYKSMTAKGLLLQVDAGFLSQSREQRLKQLDAHIGRQINSGNLLNKPACLTPLPLSGVPGWWPHARQDSGFYNDDRVFRPPPDDVVRAPISHIC